VLASGTVLETELCTSRWRFQTGKVALSMLLWDNQAVELANITWSNDLLEQGYHVEVVFFRSWGFYLRASLPEAETRVLLVIIVVGIEIEIVLSSYITLFENEDRGL
jgi:hypothetical protein